MNQVEAKQRASVTIPELSALSAMKPWEPQKTMIIEILVASGQSQQTLSNAFPRRGRARLRPTPGLPGWIRPNA